MTDDDLVREVKEELSWDPLVDDEAIAVAARDGQVTLRGTVGSLRECRAAVKTAERVRGVVAVTNDLEVRPLGDRVREDADLRGDVLQALTLNGLVPSTVDVRVKYGIVTLTGSARWEYQRAEAESVAASVVGTRGLYNEIELERREAGVGDIHGAIQRAFERNAALDADRLSITSDDGTVTISGTVRSWAERDQALAAAWAAPGVVAVRDRMRIQY
jgi:osmotically-inducible protein OsmY